ncbi:DNA primase/polymerase [Arthrobacter phage Shambre1]|uniref:DNA primase/polymerase n=1 Tax=Arthrobacter phage Shambre1 TaxID=2927284 RepID=A0A977KNN2_9CAUD|nr:DNA primase/polymerase [Arthrobacter phage Shambre1]UXE04788.1 DNA primase/polymerase [Arthrobacter phage Shambre1]
MTNHTLTAAQTLAAAGISVVKVKADGSKRPAGEWKEHQARHATDVELQMWFGNGHPAIGIITGAVSGNLEMAEIEGRAAHQLPQIQQLAEDNGLGALWAKVCNGWLERSPSGGYHWFYRLPYTPPKNTKLASRPATPEELAANPKERRKVLTETRGEGGFVVTAPSHGPTHESRQPWELVAGGPATVPTLTEQEHEQMHLLLASINVEDPEAPAQQTTSHNAAPASGMFGTVSPGDDYEARTDWSEILIPAGWRLAFGDGAGVRYWTRPGKSFGISATTGKDPARDRIFVFTSSTEFEQETPYTKFGAYALLHHGGDHSRAASELRRSGYGQDAQIGTGGGAAPNSGASPFSAGPGAAARELSSAPVAADEWTTTGLQPAAQSDGSSALATVTDIAPRLQAAATVAHTDDGNAARLILEHGWELRYNADRGRWLHWTGNIWEWQPNGGGAARELAKNVIRTMPVDNGADREWKKKSLSAAAIGNMLKQAETDPRITVKTADLDARAWELNTPTGIIDLKTATLREPDPESLHTKMTACGPDFEGRSELWDNFLADTFQDNVELLGYMHRLAGYSAVGLVREHVLPFGLGDGGNGKGAMFEALKGVLGDYATTAPAGFLMKTTFQNHPTDLAALHGARMVLCSEVNAGDKFDEGKMKQLAGGDSITARFMRQDNFTFKPTHQLWLFANHRPGVEAGGDGFWRRLRLIPFTHTVPEEKKIVGLSDMLAGEHGPIVLAWIARGAADYYRNGLQEPDQVKAATKAYAHDVDTIARFLEDECEVDPNPVPGASALTTCNALRNAYERYCKSNGDDPIKGRNFVIALEKRGVRTGRDVPKGPNGQRMYLGVRLLSQTFFPADEEPAAPVQQPAPGF